MKHAFRSCLACRGVTLLSGSLLLLLAGVPRATAAWPEFRGPTGDGHAAPSEKPPLEWSETTNVKWKTPIPYRGWSAPVVLNDEVWITTATVEGNDLYAIKLDANTGRILLNEKMFHLDHPEPLGNGASMNSYATPSCLIEPGRVFVHFGSLGTACLNTADGKVLWQRDDLPCRHYRGASSSPISFGNTVILTFDGVDQQYLVALDKDTGKTVWRTDRSVAWNDEGSSDPMVRDGDRRKAHSTPLIVSANGAPQMITAGAKAAYGYDPRTGKELWRVQYDDWSAAPVPVFDADRGVAFIVTGLRLVEMLAVRTDLRGDVTDTAVVWSQRRRVGKYASPLLVDGLIYIAGESSFLACIDAATGEEVWTERVGGKFAASPVYADGRIYFFSQEGVTTVIKPGRTFELLARNTLDDGFMASPAVSDNALFLRTKSHLYRIQEP
ncbi:MAG: PQQ-like beta-propeller repeat protein [Verrucomicrobiae bacterium]|nr:PQQ-like beta-propeller repeat protein [Verrucomicrobiae bacterium]